MKIQISSFGAEMLNAFEFEENPLEWPAGRSRALSLFPT